MVIGTSIITILILAALDWKKNDFERSLSKNFLPRNISYMLSSLIVLFLLQLSVPQLKEYFNPWFRPNPWVDFIGVFLMGELFNWVLHYIKHKNNRLWRLHFQHHLSENYSIWLTSHLHPGELFISGILINSVLILLGFSSVAVTIYFTFYSFGNLYQHSSSRLSLGPLDYLIVSPRYHRLHHKKSGGRNYGSVLTVWDIILGTADWPKGDEKNIGILNKGEPFGFFKEITYFFKK